VASSGTFYADARICRCAAAIAPLTIRYEASSKAYTVTISGRSQTFRPSDIDTAQSSAALTVYTKTSGSLTESLSLTAPGTSGVLTYKYVGGGYWQRVSTSGDHADFTFDGFSYGVKTPDPAVPRAGTAQYSIDVLGSFGFGIPVALSGTGSIQLDFGTGLLIAKGSIKQISIETGSVMGTGGFFGKGALASGSNLFNGGFSFEAMGGTMSGSMQGRFYGPAAEEVGGVFAVTAPDGRAAVGTLLGRSAGPLGGDASFDSLAHSQFFANDSAVMRATFSGAAPSAESAANDPLVVNYDVTTNSYTLIAGDGRTYAGGFGNPSDTFVQQPAGALHYMRTGLWTRAAGGGGTTINAVTFGMATPNANVPRAGSGLYPVTLVGKMTDATQAAAPLDLSGSGTLTADFATGAIDVTGDVTASYLPLSGRPPAVTGTFAGSGSIASGVNALAGSFTVDVLGHHVGTFAGRFYGPNAQEVGVTFQGKSTADNNVVAGSLFGAGVTDVPLTALTRTSPLPRLPGYLEWFRNPTTGVAGGSTQPSEGNQPHLVYEAGTPRATISYDNETTTILTFGEADRVVAASNAWIDVYRKTVGGNEYETRIYNPAGAGAPLALTYTSFATLSVRTPANPAVENSLEVTRQFTFLIGVPMSPLLAPKTGSASYHGIVGGRGYGGDKIYELSGTSALAVDFGAGTAHTTLNIQGTNLANSSVFDFGIFTFDGQTGNFYTGVGETAGFGFNGGPGKTLNGFFFGRRADEFGATFSVAADGATLVGVTVGKKD